jgi:hypothetical protein
MLLYSIGKIELRHTDVSMRKLLVQTVLPKTAGLKMRGPARSDSIYARKESQASIHSEMDAMRRQILGKLG